MELKNIEQVHRGEYLSYYNLHYVKSDGSEKVYEIVSKTGSKFNNSNQLDQYSLGKVLKAVVLVVFNKDHSKMLFSKEFRLGINEFIYNNVAGFIDEGETIIEAATRELKEETGLDLIKVIDVLEPSFTCAPVTDDCVPVIICEADGTIVPSKDELERTEPVWFTKEQVAEQLRNSAIAFAGRLQAFAYMWCNEF